MKRLLLFLLGISTFEAYSQQAAQISIRENIFNNFTYSQNKEKITPNQVKSAMINYPETQKKYVTGQRNIAIGGGMKVATAILLTSGLIYFIAEDYSIRGRNVFLSTGTAGTILGVIGPGIKEEGKRNVSDAVQEYNYQILRNPDLLLNQKSLQVRNPYAVGWTFNF